MYSLSVILVLLGALASHDVQGVSLPGAEHPAHHPGKHHASAVRSLPVVGDIPANHSDKHHAPAGRSLPVVGETPVHHSGKHHAPAGRSLPVVGETPVHLSGKHPAPASRSVPVFGESTMTHHSGKHHAPAVRSLPVIGETPAHHSGKHNAPAARSLLVVGETPVDHSGKSSPAMVRRQNAEDGNAQPAADSSQSDPNSTPTNTPSSNSPSPSQLSRRRVQTVAPHPDSQEAKCPAPLSACPINSAGMAGSWECLDLQDELSSCGRCGNDCMSLPNTGNVGCQRGSCKIFSCAAGYMKTQRMDPSSKKMEDACV